MFDGRFRTGVEKITAPAGRWLVKRRVSADVLTGSGLVFAAATAVAIGAGRHFVAIILLTLTGFHDMLDGAVAKASHRASQRGSFFDSVVDRVSDSLLMGGVAYYLTAHGHGQLVLLPFAILTTTFLISYQRSKAESLGLSARGGLMERAERMILLGVALLTSAVFLPVLWLMLALTAMTALGRFRRVWRAAARPERIPRRPDLRTHRYASRVRRRLARAARH